MQIFFKKGPHDLWPSLLKIVVIILFSFVPIWRKKQCKNSTNRISSPMGARGECHLQMKLTLKEEKLVWCGVEWIDQDRKKQKQQPGSASTRPTGIVPKASRWFALPSQCLTLSHRHGSPGKLIRNVAQRRSQIHTRPLRCSCLLFVGFTVCFPLGLPDSLYIQGM